MGGLVTWLATQGFLTWIQALAAAQLPRSTVLPSLYTRPVWRPALRIYYASAATGALS